jgi:hypothetical protein
MDGDTPRRMGSSPDGRLFLIPTAALDIAPTWQEAAAMRGTGSNAASVPEVFVPEMFAHTPAKPLVIDRPLFHLPSRLLFSSCPPAVAFGVLDTAWQSATAELSTKVSSLSGQALRDQAPIQELIANCSAALRAVRAGHSEAMNAVWNVACTGAEVSQRLKADLYASNFYALEIVRDTISRLYTRGTRVAFMQGNAVERALRNVHAIVFGVELARPIHHAADRVLLGGEPLDPAF